MGPNGRERRVSPAGRPEGRPRYGTAAATSSPPGPGPSPAGRVFIVGRAAAGGASAAAALHAGQIEDGFLSRLGPRFLGRLYRRIDLAPGSFLLTGEESGRVRGFIAGTEDLGALYRSFLWHDGLPAAWAAAPWLFREWRRALETLRQGAVADQGPDRDFELLAVAVDPASRGGGLGGRLVGGFLDEVVARGGDAARVVVGADNRAAIGLYARWGFEVADRFELHAGTESLLMRWSRGRGRPDGVR